MYERDERSLKDMDRHAENLREYLIQQLDGEGLKLYYELMLDVIEMAEKIKDIKELIEEKMT